MKVCSLAEAVEDNVRPGDTVHVMMGHSRWTAAARELARQQWGSDAGLTLVMTSLGALGALFFRGNLVRRVITTYSGDSFPTYSPNPIFQEAYASGRVEVEQWSILTLAQRLEAAARGLPALVTGSLEGTEMAANDSFSVVESPFGPVGLVAPLVPDVALVHAAAADREGNLLLAQPLLEGVWGAWAARRGVVATVEQVIDDVRDLGGCVRIPAHRVLAIAVTRFGAHPGGCYVGTLPVNGYGEDVPYWTEVAQAARGDFDAWAKRNVLDPKDHEAYLVLLGTERQDWLASRTDPASWKQDADATPLPVDEPVSRSETAAAFGAREVERVIELVEADAVLAGAGLANLAAWVAVGRRRSQGHHVQLTAELGLFGYEPTPADPYIFNHRVFPDTPFLSDASTVLGMVIGGPGSRVVGCLGAAEVDRQGNLNSTRLADGRFLVGSGGANDVAARAEANVIITLARPERLPDTVGYVTSSGVRVFSIVTDLGVLRRVDDQFRIAALPPGSDSLAERVRRFVGACGWEPDVARELEELAPVEGPEVLALRDYDRERLFLR